MDRILQDKIGVYIYTAVNGYAWQGCDRKTSDSLQKCVGQIADGEAGGIRRGTVDGLNGTAFFRCHVRKGGDFAGRDSSYVALAFIPFAHIGARCIDYVKLWRHPLLAEPLPGGRPLERLVIDIVAEGLVANNPSPASAGGFWLAERPTKDNPDFGDSGTEEEVLKRLGAMFQSRETELGSLSARLSQKDGGRIFARLEYIPFRSVAEEVEACRAYGNAIDSGAAERDKTTLLNRWRDAVGKLKGLADPANGGFSHFIGFCEYVRMEEDALRDSMGGEAEKKAVSDVLVRIRRMLDCMGSNLTGGETPLFDEIEAILGEAAQKTKRLGGDAAALEKACRDCETVLKRVRAGSAEVVNWRDAIIAGQAAAIPAAPACAAASLRELAAKLGQSYGSIAAEKARNSELDRERASLREEKNKLANRILQTQSAGASGRASPLHYSSNAGGAESGGRRGSIWGRVLDVGIYVTFAVTAVVVIYCIVSVLGMGWKDRRNRKADKPHVLLAPGMGNHEVAGYTHEAADIGESKSGEIEEAGVTDKGADADESALFGDLVESDKVDDKGASSDPDANGEPEEVNPEAFGNDIAVSSSENQKTVRAGS